MAPLLAWPWSDPARGAGAPPARGFEDAHVAGHSWSCYETVATSHEPFALLGAAAPASGSVGLRLTHACAARLTHACQHPSPPLALQVLPSIVTEVVKQVIAQFNATALLTQREQVSRKIKDLLAERAREFAIVLEVRACLQTGKLLHA